MKTASNMNIGTRICANLIFLLAVIVLCTFGIGGNDWGTGFWISIPLFIWSFCLTFKANHTVRIK